MSTSMKWIPVEESPGNYLDSSLKHVVSQRWFHHDGSLHGEITLDDSNIPYLLGVADASSNQDTAQEARDLVQAIVTHKVIRVWID